MTVKVKKKKITMEYLAAMTQRGFLGVSKDIKTIKDDVSFLKSDVSILKRDVAEIKVQISDLNEKYSKVLDALDKVAKQYADYLEERKLRDAEMARLKKWIEQIAQKVGVQLVD